MATNDTYRIVRRLPNGNDVILDELAYDETSFEDEQRIRDSTGALADQRRINNPAWRVIVYGPTNDGGPYTADDIIWDSSVNTEPF